jgi:hypothetical protein
MLSDENAAGAVKAFSIWWIVAGISLVLTGIFAPVQALVNPLTEVEAEMRIVAVVASFVMSIVTLGIGVLFTFVGLGLWHEKPWSRIVAIVLGWLGAVSAIGVMGLGALFIAVGAASESEIPEVQSALVLVSVAIGLLGLITLLFSALTLWIFQFDSTAVSRFRATDAPLRPAIAGHEMGLSRGLGIVFTVSAIGAAISAIVMGGASFWLATLLRMSEDFAIVLPYTSELQMLLWAGAIITFISAVLYFLMGRRLLERSSLGFVRTGIVVQLVLSVLTAIVAFAWQAWRLDVLASDLVANVASVLSTAAIFAFYLWIVHHPAFTAWYTGTLRPQPAYRAQAATPTLSAGSTRAARPARAKPVPKKAERTKK